jgi:hypothetical protein
MNQDIPVLHHIQTSATGLVPVPVLFNLHFARLVAIISGVLSASSLAGSSNAK